MILDIWAKRWNLPPQALQELKDLMGCGIDTMAPGTPTKPEAIVQAETRIAASKAGDRLFRNNNGAFKDENGRLIRFGVGNESKGLPYASSDLIGIRPHLVTPHDVGQTLGLFLSFETKREGWVWKGEKATPGEKRQHNWNSFFTSMGGIARFVSNVKQVYPNG